MKFGLVILICLMCVLFVFKWLIIVCVILCGLCLVIFVKIIVILEE